MTDQSKERSGQTEAGLLALDHEAQRERSGYQCPVAHVASPRPSLALMSVGALLRRPGPRHEAQRRRHALELVDRLCEGHARLSEAGFGAAIRGKGR